MLFSEFFLHFLHLRVKVSLQNSALEYPLSRSYCLNVYENIKGYIFSSQNPTVSQMHHYGRNISLFP